MVVTKKGDAFAALGLLVSMGVLYADSRGIEDTLNYALGALFFPQLMIALIALLAVILLFQSIDFSASASGCADKAPRTGLRVFATQAGLLGLLALYILVLPVTGYVPTTVVFLIVCMLFLGERTPRKLAVYALCSAVTTGVLYYVFGRLLHLFLP